MPLVIALWLKNGKILELVGKNICSVICLVVSYGGRNLKLVFRLLIIFTINAGAQADYPDSGYIRLSGKKGDNCCYMMDYI